jgi:hypothetical protein
LPHITRMRQFGAESISAHILSRLGVQSTHGGSREHPEPMQTMR